MSPMSTASAFATFTWLTPGRRSAVAPSRRRANARSLVENLNEPVQLWTFPNESPLETCCLNGVILRSKLRNYDRLRLKTPDQARNIKVLGRENDRAGGWVGIGQVVDFVRCKRPPINVIVNRVARFSHAKSIPTS